MKKFDNFEWLLSLPEVKEKRLPDKNVLVERNGSYIVGLQSYISSNCSIPYTSVSLAPIS